MRNMSIFKYFYSFAMAALLASAPFKPGLAEEALTREGRHTGFLVVAADRGFVGNEEIIDAFQQFAKGRNASLIFVTDERTQRYLRTGVDRLLNKGAARIVVIPLFISAADPRYGLARQLLENERITAPVSFTRPYGESFFAVEDLTDRFRMIPQPAETSVVVVGYGAVDNDSEQKMKADWKRIAGKAAAGFDFPLLDIVIGRDKKDDDAEERTARLKQALAEAAHGTGSGGARKTVVVPFHFGPRFDSMMSFDTGLKRLLPSGARFLADGNTDGSPDASQMTGNLAIWLQHEANRSQPLSREDIGVVFLSHGSDFHWNETMREAVRPLVKRYKIEFAFSMADQATIERAIRKLEQRGAKAAVIVRVFAMEDSFRRSIERMAGLDVENPVQDAPDTHAGHGHGHGAAVPAPRIRTSLPIQTVGGLGSSPLFAAALLDRARTLSKNPARDTVILVAHGSGSDHQNEHWNRKLEEIAEYMRKANGSASEFRAIKVATWREDWPDKRGPWIEKVRTMVEEAGSHGGRAIVIPARTTGEGPEKKFLSGLEFDLGSGFAPHPMFVQWVDEQIKAGLAQFTDVRGTGMATAENGDSVSYPEKGPWW
ncbi:MAG: CbiX/SirB N-terminal domain-containing protein [Nitrosospira sp.]